LSPSGLTAQLPSFGSFSQNVAISAYFMAQYALICAQNALNLQHLKK